MKSRGLLVLAIGVLAALAWMRLEAQAPARPLAHRFERLADGVYAALPNGPDTMEKVLQIDFDTIIPGHGDPFKDKDRVRKYQSYLRDLWKQAGDLKKQGVSSDDAAKRIDLTSHKADFPTIQGPGVDPRAMLRIYDVMDGRLTPR